MRGKQSTPTGSVVKGHNPLTVVPASVGNGHGDQTQREESAMARTNATQVVEEAEAASTAEATPAVEVPTLEELGAKDERFAKQAEQEVVNPIVLAGLIGCRPQMVYSYIRKGRIAGVKDNNTQKLVIPLAEAQRWANEYLQRKALKAIRIKDELAAAETESEG
jgi:type IV secretory pathway VirJ component